MNKEPYGRILHIIPAQPGWMAVYPSDEDNETSMMLDVVCWALMEDKQGHTFVQGMVSSDSRLDLVYAGSIQNGVMYLSPAQADIWRKEEARHER